MRASFSQSMTAAIIFTVVVTGLLGLFLFLPIICINWAWDSVVTAILPVPSIAIWQACLLYMALITAAYLLGLLQVEFKTEIEE